MLENIREANLKFKPSKCQGCQIGLKFGGHLVGRKGIRPDLRNVKKIKNAKVPKNTTELRRFLRMAQYYRQYINGYADLAGPLYDMLKENRPAVWEQAQQEAFDIIKNKLVTELIRAYSDFNKPFKLYTDASDTGLGAVLAQDDEEGKERVIAYEARRLSASERNYPTTEKECLAVVWAIQKFKQYLGGWIPFTVYTDHAALKTLMKHDNLTLRRARWMEVLATYFFEIEHRPGKKMGHADYLSRINQTNPEYLWDRKDAKYILNVVYNDRGVYGSERYKDPMEGLIQVPCGKVDPGETSYQAVIRETVKETGLTSAPKYLCKDDRFNCDLYTTNIGDRKPEWTEPEKNDPWTFYTWAEWNEMAEQEELTPSLITFNRKIRAETSTKGKQPKYEEKIHKITIIECPTCGKMVEKEDDHYCPPMRETDPSILVNTP